MANKKSIEIPEFARKDFETLCDSDPMSLSLACNRVESLGDLFKESQFRATLDESLPSDVSAAVFRQAIALEGLIHRNRFDTAEAVLDALASGYGALALEGAKQKQRLEKWKKIRDPLAKLLRSKGVRVLAKALDLGLDRGRVFQSAKIITDARPVFDDHAGVDGPVPVASVVAQTLKISYFEDGEVSEFRFGVDAQDLDEIIRVCERAKKKSANLTELIDDFLPVMSMERALEDDNG